MRRARLFLRYLGRTPALPPELFKILASAGYRASKPRSADAGEYRIRGIGTWVGSDVTQAELRALFGAGRATGKRLRSFAIDLIRGARKPGADDDGRGASPRFSLTLQELRESVGYTQGEIARRVSMTQPQLSRVEARRDHLTSTLRRYVAAIGGELEVVAVVRGARVVLRDV
jgi:hypothetical protein